MSGLHYRPQGTGLGVFIRSNYPCLPQLPKRDSSLLSQTHNSSNRTFKENRTAFASSRKDNKRSYRQISNQTLHLPPQEYFRNCPKNAVSLSGFEDKLFTAFWKVSVKTGDRSSPNRTREFESFEVNKLNDKSIHFSRLDESLTVKSKGELTSR